MVPQITIVNKIYLIRGKRVMFDKDLAELYGVSTKRLNEQVKRNNKRFPKDFMFQIKKDEIRFSRSQFATLKRGKNIKYLPYAFTELGVAMLSGVLNSDRAISVNIQIMRVFTKVRNVLSSHKKLERKVEEVIRIFDSKLKDHDDKFKLVFDAINRLFDPPRESRKKKYGFVVDKA
ncbi:MAG: ORF6N domain-containing protein [Candidatus Margulisbacteria bacterium]|nr:ORF6N domain-containing protein [Candidatus Margulisiibacteriota bacterium]